MIPFHGILMIFGIGLTRFLGISLNPNSRNAISWYSRDLQKLLRAVVQGIAIDEDVGMFVAQSIIEFQEALGGGWIPARRVQKAAQKQTGCRGGGGGWR